MTTESHNFKQEWFNDNSFVIAHTSGSTGNPKEIRLLKTDMKASAISTCKFFNLDHNSRLVCSLSVDYIAGKMMMVRSFVSQSKIEIEKPSNEPLKHYHGRADLVAVVPSQVPGLISSAQHCDIRNVIIGGGPISHELEESLYSQSFISYATYGMTETCSHVALRHIVPGNNTFIALPGYTFERDARGCLVINTTLQSFKRLVTNDIVDLVDSKSFIWLGRFDNAIITAGLKVLPEILEDKIRPHISSHRFYVKGVHDDKWGQHVALVIESNPFDPTELLVKLSNILKPHELPREVIFIDHFKMTESGKIIRI